MTLSDWERKINNKYEEEWQNKKNGYSVRIYIVMDGYELYTYKDSQYPETSKKFKTKSQALKLAKQYMAEN